MNIFCDGVFDLFHYGHINHFKKIKDAFPGCKLIVGIFGDEDSTLYKRKPYYNEKKRKDLVSSCKYVDLGILDYPAVMTEEFMRKYSIDLVVHAFSDDNDFLRQQKYFEVPIKLNKFKRLEYDSSISSSQILSLINNSNNLSVSQNKSGWDLIWELKGKTEENNPYVLNGYEETSAIPNKIYTNIVDNLNLRPDDKVLEVGCGAGLLTDIFEKNNYSYYGIDYSQNLIVKNIKLFNSKVINCEANNIPFHNKYFDYAFCVGVVEYFPDKNYTQQVIDEMMRVCKKGIYILNIRKKTHTEKKNKHKFDGVFTHLVHQESDSLFDSFKILDSTYEHQDRFSAIKFIK